MSDDFQFFLPITKVDKERRTVSGYATTEARDLDGERISLDAVRKALPGYMQWRNIREMHTNSAVGKAQEVNVDDKGLFLTAKIVDEKAWNKVLEGVYQGYSIGGRTLNKIGDTITELELVEISIVDRPCNAECRFEVQKRASADAEAYLVQLRRPRNRKDEAIEKMAEVVQTLTRDDDDDFDLDALVDAPLSSPVPDDAAPHVVEKGAELGRELGSGTGDTAKSDDRLILAPIPPGGDKENELLNPIAPDVIFKQISKQVKKMAELDLVKAASANPILAARGNLKKSKAAMREAEDCIKTAHATVKAAILAKAGKSDNDEDDMMKTLQKAYAAVQAARTFNKAANGQLKKAAGGPTDSTGEYVVPAGVKEVSPEASTGMFQLDQAPGANGTVKGVKVEGFVSQSEADALMRAAAAEAKVSVLEKLPAAGRRPMPFDMPTATGSEPTFDPTGMEPEEAFRKAGALHIGNIINKGGKSVFDPDFKGGAI